MPEPRTLLALPRATGLLLLGWLRGRILRAGGRALVRNPVKLVLIAGVWAALLVLLYALAHRGIRFLYETAGVGPFLLDRVWYLFLFVVVVLLAVSQFAGAYSTLVRAPETRWWMGLPLTARTLCRAKWLESSFYSAWAVVLLVVPVYLAHLAVGHRSLALVGWMLVLLVPLIALVTALATAGLLVWLRWFGRVAIRREVAVLGFVAASATLFWMLGEWHEEPTQDAWFVALQELLPRMRVAMSPWVPSSWMAKALGAGLNGLWREGLLYAALLWATAALAWRVLDHTAAALLLPVLREQAHTGARRRARAPGPLRVSGMPRGMRRPFRASLVKDLLLVLRDPMQWSQAVVFFGLLGAYFANIHRLANLSVEPAWRVGIASLNLACTLLVLGSLAVRFVFPQMSLEGRSLWVLRMAPHGTRRLLFAKLCLYGVLAVLIISGLLWLSMSRLDVPMGMRWWLAGIGLIAALALVAMTVGLGAWWVDPSAQDAARIVSSANGAMVLLLVLVYVGCVVAALLGVWTSWAAASVAGMLAAASGLLALSLLAGWLPVHQGLARLERLEPPA